MSPAFDDKHLPDVVIIGIDEQARQLADQFGCHRVDDRSQLPCPPGGLWWLAWRDDQLELGATHAGAPKSGLSVDFVGGRLGRRLTGGFGARQPLGRALGGRSATTTGRRLVDATAGLGRDTFLAAQLGHSVLAVERSPVLVALLEDGLRRAAAEPRLRPLVERVELRCGEARDVLLGDDSELPAVVYLDPMFPEPSNSARVKKPMQLLQRLVGGEADETLERELLDVALARATRVVVKRPAHAPAWVATGPRAPSSSIRGGRTTRYDIYLGA